MLMLRHRRRAAAFAAGLALVVLPVVASADLMKTAVSMAAPLAEKFGVPADLVSGLLDGGFDLETVVQSLLIDQAAESTGFGEIADQLKGGTGIADIASGLGVDPSAYADAKVDAVLDDLKGQAGDAVKGAVDDAAGKASEALGGLGK